MFCSGVLDHLSLHSSGLILRQVSDLLRFNRRARSYTLNERPIPAKFARQFLRPALQAHEEWTIRRFGPAYRQVQFSAQRLPRPVARSLESWRQYICPAAFLLPML